MSEKTNDILRAALCYRRKGWSTIPIKPGTKRAAVAWKQYQEQAADERQLRAWFGNGETRALAVILGEVSGGLVCRDFDDADAYKVWAARYPDLAETLPTVATSRGRHVYFRAEDLKSRKQEGGEYRANGNYTLLPPSLHPDGPTYRWVVPLPEGDLPLVDPVACGLLPATPEKETARAPTSPDAALQGRSRQGLGQRTYRFLKAGAVEGHRNSELFSAACDMKANHVRRDRAEEMLLEACGRCRPPYPAEEALASIASAYSRPRTAIRAADSPLARYTIPRCIAQRRDLTGSDKVVWAALDYRQRDKAACFPSMATTARDTGLNPDTVNEAVKRLERAGLLTVERSEGEVNRYTKHLPEIPRGPGKENATLCRQSPAGKTDANNHSVCPSG